jgi:sulfonate transport system permease protein
MSALAWRGAGLAVVVALIALWGEIAALKLVSPVFLPTPARVWMALEHGFLHATLGAKLMGTVSHMLGGWVVASIVGVALGALIGTSEAAREYIAPTLEFLRPLPASAIIPVVIAIFGLTPQMALGVIAFGSIWPALFAAIHGFAAIELRLLEVERVLGSLAGDREDLIALRDTGYLGWPETWPDGVIDFGGGVRNDRRARWAWAMGAACGALL